MMNNEKKKTVKMNLSLDAELFNTLEELAKRDYLAVATWTKQFLKRQINDLLEFDELVRSEKHPF